MESFLLQHYAQVNEHLRESDRKRDILLGSYLTLSIAGLSICFSLEVVPAWKIGILTFLICLGFIVAVTVTRFRGWHAEYANVAMAIHKCFIDGHYNLLKAAKDLKHKNKYPYFSPGGVEFMMAMLVLVFLSVKAILLTYWVFDLLKLHLNLLLNIGIILVIILVIIGGGRWRYKVYLVKREMQFPENSWCILVGEEKGHGIAQQKSKREA